MIERHWRTSSYTGNQGDCVEVALKERVAIRDTKNRDGGQLAVPATGWSQFIASVKRGEAGR